MTPPADPERYKHHRFPGEIISHGVWLYYRFPLSYRDVEEMLLARGIEVTHEAIRQWCLKFGQDYANQLKHRRAQPGDKWHLDEVFLTINGERHYLWRAVGAPCKRYGGMSQDLGVYRYPLSRWGSASWATS
jgi:putative transposase